MVQIWNNYILFPDSVKKYIGSEFRVFWIRIKIFGWIRIQLNMDSKHCCSLPFSSISFTDHDVEEGFVYFSQITYQIFVTVFFFKLLMLFGLKWFWSCLKKNVHFVYRHFLGCLSFFVYITLPPLSGVWITILFFRSVKSSVQCSSFFILSQLKTASSWSTAVLGIQ